MKIVMSMSTDFMKNVDSNTILSMHYFYLASLLAKSHYTEVQFVTDRTGQKICNLLDAPFTDVTVMDFDKVSDRLWAYSKLKAYEMQKDPFIHIDNDVFLFRRLPKEVEKSGICTEMREKNNFVYDNYDKLYFDNTPSSYMKYANDKIGYCMGIFGGQDIDFIQDYTRKALCWCKSKEFSGVNRDIRVMPKVEQQLLYCEEKDQNKTIYSMRENGCSPRKTGYLHLQNDKFTPIYDKRISDYFRIYFPREFKNIQGKIRCLIKIITASDQSVTLT